MVVKEKMASRGQVRKNLEARRLKVPKKQPKRSRLWLNDGSRRSYRPVFRIVQIGDQAMLQRSERGN